MIEDINSSLLDVFNRFDTHCKENSCLYNIVCDEPDIQGYVLHNKRFAPRMYDYLQPVLQSRNVHLNMDSNRTDGVLFTFTIKAIRDDHWKVLPANPKSDDYSIFVKASDAKKVRNKETIYQKEFDKKLDDVLENNVKAESVLHKEAEESYKEYYWKICIPRLTRSIMEQYGWSNEDSKNHAVYVTKNIFEERAPLDFSYQDLVEAQYKSPTKFHKRNQQQYRSRFANESVTTGAVAGSSIPPLIEPTSSLGLQSAARSTSTGENQTVAAYPDRKDATDNPTTVNFDDMLSATLEERLGLASSPGTQDDYVQDGGVQPGPMAVPGDTASVAAMDPTGGMLGPETAQTAITAPMGTEGPKTTEDPNVSDANSNVRISHVSDFFGPMITSEDECDYYFNEKKRKEILKEKDYKIVATEGMHDRLTKMFECLEEKGYLPEDGIDFMQQLNKELCINGGVRKYDLPNKTNVVKACNGIYRLELENDTILIVYKEGKKLKEFDVDLSKNTIVDEICSQILKLME